MTRTFVVGLDGASWRLLDPWIEAGELPNLDALRQNGSWSDSRSCLPPVTFPNWKCYSSGKNPGKFGVFWFERVDLANGSIEIVNGSDFRTAELWDYLNAADLQTGVVNMPTMYPPREIDGPIVCGGPDAVDGEYRSIDSGYTSPAELEALLEDRYDYQVHPEPLLSSNAERGEEVEAILEMLDLRFRVALDLFQEESLDFMHVTLFYLNVLHHFFWDEQPSKRAWTLIDEWIARLVDLEDTNLILMSDHGSAPTTTEFYINEWLAANSYLTTQRTPEDLLKSLGITRKTALTVAKRFGLVDFLAGIVPERIQQLVPQEAGAKRGRKLAKINLEQTKAVASGQGPIYINPKFRSDSTLDSVIEELEQISDEQGNPLFENVYRGSEIYRGPFVEDGPDIVLDQRPGIHINDGIGRGEVFAEPDRWAAENTKTGIFAATGPDVENQGQIEDIHNTDIAPTILATHDIPIPTDIDGDVLSILTGDQEPTETQDPLEIGSSDQFTDKASVENRLKQLGYME